MNATDARGCEVSGVTSAALEAYEDALGAQLSWRSGAAESLGVVLQLAPRFVMAHVLQAWMLVCSRDPQRVRSARAVLAHAAGLPANERERMHLGAIAAALDDDYELAKARLGRVLRRQPCDALALQVAHAFDYFTGDVARIAERVATALPAWSSDLPDYHAVLAMHAFGLAERGEYERATQAADAALRLNPFDARAHHAMVHVFEMSDRAVDGMRWMEEHRAGWTVDTVVATHCWWHMALFHVSQGQVDGALQLYDRRLRAVRSAEVADLIDAAALLWRIELYGGDTGRRWLELALAWAAHIDDDFCSFNDLHAMLTFVGARDWNRALALEQALVRAARKPTRHGQTTRQIGLPACRALIAFGRGNHALAIPLLASLPTLAHRLGGSHAQRDVLHLTLLHAAERVRRPDGRRQAAVAGRGLLESYSPVRK